MKQAILTTFGTLLLATASLRSAIPQQTTQPAPEPPHVTIHAQDADVRDVLREIFKPTKYNFTMDQSVQGKVTVTLNDVPFRTALQTVLRSAKGDRAFTYRVEDGVYIILPQADTVELTYDPASRVVKIPLSFVPAGAAVKTLKQLKGGLEGLESIAPSPSDNALLAVGTDNAIRDLKQRLNMLDVQPRQIQVKGEVILVAEGASGKKQRLLLAESGRTLNGQPLTIKTSLAGPGAAAAVRQPGTGRYSVRIEPRLNADNTIDLAATWTVGLSWQPVGSRPVHLTRTIEGALRARDGETVSLSGLIVKAGVGKANSNAELLLFLTPHVVVEGPRNPGAPMQP